MGRPRKVIPQGRQRKVGRVLGTDARLLVLHQLLQGSGDIQIAGNPQIDAVAGYGKLDGRQQRIYAAGYQLAYPRGGLQGQPVALPFLLGKGIPTAGNFTNHAVYPQRHLGRGSIRGKTGQHFRHPVQDIALCGFIQTTAAGNAQTVVHKTGKTV